MARSFRRERAKLRAKRSRPPGLPRARGNARFKSLHVEVLEPRLVLAAAPLEISEFMALNSRTLADGDGNYSDWIEIHNPTTAPVSLEGWHLTDDAAQPEKWHFPAVTLEAGGNLVVFASGKDRRVPDSELHTNFQLNGDGEYLALVQPDGHTVASGFAPAFPPQRADISFGIAAEAATNALVSAGGATKVFVPRDGALGLNWTGDPAREPLDDSPAAGWTAGVTGVGYDLDPGSGGPAPLPQAYWNFNDNVNDASGNGHGGTLNGAVYSSEVPPLLKTGKSLNFDGVNDYVSVVLDVSEQRFTVSFWFKADTTGRGLFSVVDPEMGGSGSDRHIYLTGSNIGTRLWNNEVLATSGKNYVDGKWHNLVYQYGPEIAGERVYVDAQRVAWGTKSSSDFNWQTRVHIGYSVDAAGGYFDGLMDDVAIWDTVLTEDQIRALAQGASPMAMSGYGSLIGTNIAAAMRNVNPSAYLRTTFSVATPADAQALRLRVKYDDGFVAWLNGQEIARRNAPATIAFNSTATADRSKTTAAQYEELDLTHAAALLRSGTNVLAIQGLNDQLDSNDFLVLPELTMVTHTADRYMVTATPGKANGVGSIGFVADTEFSVDRGFFNAPFSLTISTATSGATIRYTTDGSVPTETTGTLYSGPVTINRTTALRAAAFKAGYQPSIADTQTYIFPTDVIQQAGMSTVITGNSTWGPQMRDALLALPTISIVTPGGAGGLTEAEVPTSAELILPDGSKGFQIDAGIELWGGTSLQWIPMKAMRISFKGMYGPGKLNYDLFGDGAAKEFDQILLRGGSHDSMYYNNGTMGIFIRNRFMYDRQREMGQPAPHERFVHVYINGVYWGQYSLMERPNAAFMASYFGGNKADYDALNAGTVVDGDLVAWNAMLASTNDYQALQQHLDVVNYADYMLLNFYGGNDWDWGTYQNWSAARKREAGAGYKFFAWDSDMILRTGANANSVVAPGNKGGPGDMWWAISQHLEFRMLLADRAQKYFFNNGILTTNRVLADLEALAQEMSKSIIAETARWYYNSYTPATWRQNVDVVKNTIVPGRENVVIQQMRAAGVFPSINAPAFSQHGGLVAANYAVTMSGTGTMYYTLDGSDPRLPGGAISPAALVYSAANAPRINGVTLVRARAKSGTTWSALNEAQFYVNQPAAAANCVVSEINYHPYPPSAEELQINPDWKAEEFQFLELRNTGSQPIDFSGARFTVGIAFDFTGAGVTTLGPGETVVVVENQAAFEARYGAGIRVAGQYTGKLSVGGEQLVLLDYLDRPIFDFTYSDEGAWPGRADGKGSTLELIAPAAVPATEPQRAAFLEDGSHWRSSSAFLGTPGAANPAPVKDVVVNEVLANTAAPLADAIELFNTTADAIDLGGWFLSDSTSDYRKFRIPQGTVIPAGGYLVFYEGHYVNGALEHAPGEFGGPAGFGLNGARGDDVYLVQADDTGKLLRFADHVDFGATAEGESLGRWLDDQGGARLYPLLRRTLDAPNNANSSDGNGPRVGPLVISEVMYAPKALTSGEQTAGFITAEDMEFVEIFNPTAAAVDLTHWRLDKGASFEFAAGTTLAASKSLVVATFNPVNTTMLAAFRARYAMSSSLAVVGPYSGRLDNLGDKVQLQRPDAPPPDDPAWYPPLLEDQITYTSAWGGTAAENKSLQRIAADTWGDNKASWAAAAASPGTARMVAGRYLFYNNSAFDGHNSGATVEDDQAIAPDKQALLPGRRGAFDNYTTYSRGINGIMLDLAGSGTSIAASDFEFRAGNSADPAAWPLAAAPTVTVRPGAGVAGATRVTLVWSDNAIKNQWLRVKVLGNSRTGLAGPDVFYFGNTAGETGNHSADPEADATVDQLDAEATRGHRTLATPVAITNPYDFNRDRRVNATDELIARGNFRWGANALSLLDLVVAEPAAGTAAMLAAGTGTMALGSEEAVPGNGDTPPAAPETSTADLRHAGASHRLRADPDFQAPTPTLAEAVAVERRPAGTSPPAAAREVQHWAALLAWLDQRQQAKRHLPAFLRTGLLPAESGWAATTPAS